jgi:hypothetical protein
MAGIVLCTEFNLPGIGYSGYIHYTDDEKKTKIADQTEAPFGGFVGYMANELKTMPFISKKAMRTEIGSYDGDADEEFTLSPVKGTGLFTKKSDAISEAEKKEYAGKYDNAEEKGSPIWKLVFSFDFDFLEKYGLLSYPNGRRKEDGVFNAAGLIDPVRKAVDKYLKSEGMEECIWTGSFHRNVKDKPNKKLGEHSNYHVHVSIVDPDPAWEEGVGRCRRNGEGELYQRGKVKNSTLENTKSTFFSALMNGSEETKRIGALRDFFIGVRKENRFTELFREEAESLYERLPKNKRMWNYGMNAMRTYRDEIDRLTEIFIASDEELSRKYGEYEKLLDMQEQRYAEAYGSSGGYKASKIEDLYTRLGNQLLSEMKQSNKQDKPNPDKTEAGQTEQAGKTPKAASPAAKFHVTDIPPPGQNRAELSGGYKTEQTGQAGKTLKPVSPAAKLHLPSIPPPVYSHAEAHGQQAVDIYRLKTMFAKTMDNLKNQAAYARLLHEIDR